MRSLLFVVVFFFFFAVGQIGGKDCTCFPRYWNSFWLRFKVIILLNRTDLNHHVWGGDHYMLMVLCHYVRRALHATAIRESSLSDLQGEHRISLTWQGLRRGTRESHRAPIECSGRVPKRFLDATYWRKFKPWEANFIRNICLSHCKHKDYIDKIKPLIVVWVD